MDRGWLRDFLGRRVRDRTIRRAVGKWLNAGVMEDGAVRRSERGTPQGGVISPRLSNLYLHPVLDETSGSVGAGGGRPPSATRPRACPVPPAHPRSPRDAGDRAP